MKFLVLAPHWDDAEFGCGGMIARLVREGHTGHIFGLTAQADRCEEAVAACEVLGCGESSEYLNQRTLPDHRQRVLECLLDLSLRYQPGLVFAPSRHDTHQDHEVVTAEAFRAFKHCSLYGYEVPWNNVEFAATAFVPITAEDLETKWRAIECYKSQAGKPYADRDLVNGLAKVRGVQCGHEYAEAFECIRHVMA